MNMTIYCKPVCSVAHKQKKPKRNDSNKHFFESLTEPEREALCFIESAPTQKRGPVANQGFKILSITHQRKDGIEQETIESLVRKAVITIDRNSQALVGEKSHTRSVKLTKLGRECTKLLIKDDYYKLFLRNRAEEIEEGDTTRTIELKDGSKLDVVVVGGELAPYMYLRTSIPNAFFKENLSNVTYVDISGCFPTSFDIRLQDPECDHLHREQMSNERRKTLKDAFNPTTKTFNPGSPGILQRPVSSGEYLEFRGHLIHDDIRYLKTLGFKSEINAALFGWRGCTHPAIKAYRLLAKRYKRFKGLSNRSFYYDLASVLIPTFLKTLDDMGVLVVPRLDGAIVRDSVDMNFLNEKMQAICRDVKIEVKEKQEW